MPATMGYHAYCIGRTTSDCGKSLPLTVKKAIPRLPSMPHPMTSPTPTPGSSTDSWTAAPLGGHKRSTPDPVKSARDPGP
eukprot:scaffold123923_cov32-Tisochrysis_lutea.AAC.3